MTKSAALRIRSEEEVLSAVLAFYSVGAALDRAHAAELGPVHLSINQWHVLNVLYRNREPMTMRQLSDTISMRPTNLTGVVDSLVRRDLVQRKPNVTDRRSWLVNVTRDGTKFLDGFLPAHWEYLEQLMSGLSREDRGTLRDLLLRFKQSIDVAELARTTG